MFRYPKIAKSIIFLMCLIKLSSCYKNNNVCFQDLQSCGTNENNSTLCCPYKNGQCCNFKINNQKPINFCCPENATCFPNVGHCMPRNKIGLMKTTKIYSPAPLHVQDSRTKLEVCPFKKTICPSKSTCCAVPYKGFDCCPIIGPKGESANCCENFKFCCPYNTTCDIKKGECIDVHQRRSPWIKKIEAAKSDFTHVKKVKLIKNLIHICPDQETRCEHNHTCCSSGHGKYKCCQFANAVCCSEGTHCCPHNTICGTSSLDCIRVNSESKFDGTEQKNSKNGYNLELDLNNEVQLLQFTHYRLKWLLTTGVSSKCPGGQWTCPNFMTCVKIRGEKYGCCPFPNAVSCNNKMNCCPSGCQCDLIEAKCRRGVIFMPLSKTISATKVYAVTDDVCPDKTTCPDNFTCCQLPSLGYGCCPLASATCCPDKIHCCPHGTVCDLKAGTCKSGNQVDVQFLQRINATTVAIKSHN